MAGDRYVILGLAHPRAAWFRTVAQWANASSIPVELVKCLSAEELRARVASGRAFSAAIVDARVPALDRDLLDELGRAACPTLVVEDRRRRTDWLALGAAAVLLDGFDREDLLRALAAHAAAIASGGEVPGTFPGVTLDEPRGTVVGVCGPGGTGASTVAMALSQGLAEAEAGSSNVTGGRVILADLDRNAEQAMLHDAGDIVPGVQELVEAHRNGQPGRDAVMALTFLVEARGYHLLLGLRRSSAWAALRPRAFEAGFSSLRHTFTTVVADVEADVEGERDGGSLDVEERNVMSRTVMGQSDVVLVVGAPGMKGVHSLGRVVSDLLGLGVPGSCIVPVVNRAPRSRRGRAEITAAFAAVVGSTSSTSQSPFRGTPDRGLAAERASIASPIFLPERRIEECLRDGVPLPPQVTEPLTGAVRAVLARREGRQAVAAEPERVVPGSIGHWSQDDAGAGADAEEALG